MSGYVPTIPRAKREAEIKGVQPVEIHAERWAEYARYGSQPAGSPKEVKLALRIGVFFDGTLNNATNAALGLSTAACWIGWTRCVSRRRYSSISPATSFRRDALGS